MCAPYLGLHTLTQYRTHMHTHTQQIIDTQHAIMSACCLLDALGDRHRILCGQRMKLSAAAHVRTVRVCLCVVWCVVCVCNQFSDVGPMAHTLTHALPVSLNIAKH